MKRNEAIKTLKYRIERYKAMGNGIMCQSLSQQLREAERKCFS